MAKMKQVRQNKSAKQPKSKAALIASNKKAHHDYHILDEFEAGMVLTGTEVKSLREGRASLAEGFCTVDRGGEVWAENLYIPEYLSGSWTNHMARRKRKLLLNRDEIRRIERKLQDAGTTIVPLKLYFNEDGRVKLEIATAQGKKEFDKRHTLREKQDNREAQRAMRLKNRGVQR